MKLTPWYPGTVKPVRDGIYQRKSNRADPREIYYAKFSRGRWLGGYLNLQNALVCKWGSGTQSAPWRGVSK